MVVFTPDGSRSFGGVPDPSTSGPLPDPSITSPSSSSGPTPEASQSMSAATTFLSTVEVGGREPLPSTTDEAPFEFEGLRDDDC